MLAVVFFLSISLSQTIFRLNLFGIANCGNFLSGKLRKNRKVDHSAPAVSNRLSLGVGLRPVLTPHRLETCRNETQPIADGSVCTFARRLPHNEGAAIHVLNTLFSDNKSAKARVGNPSSGSLLRTYGFVDVFCETGENQSEVPRVRDGIASMFSVYFLPSTRVNI